MKLTKAPVKELKLPAGKAEAVNSHPMLSPLSL